MLSNRVFWITALVLAGFVYWRFDPAQVAFFPKCPFFMLTGWQCAGCGSQRCVHALLHGHWAEAWQVNPLLVLALPYLLAIVYIEYFGGKYRFPHWRNALMGLTAIKIILVVVILFGIGRNLYFKI